MNTCTVSVIAGPTAARRPSIGSRHSVSAPAEKITAMAGDEARAVISAKDVSAAAAAQENASGGSVKLPGVQKSLKKKPQKPKFPALSALAASGGKTQFRQVPIPAHRMTPLRDQWMKIYEPIVKQLKLQIRMNTKKRCVELKTCKKTTDAGALQKGADFVKAFVMGFAVADAIALLRLDDLYLESFMVQDIRSTLKGDHLARAVGRIAGKDGKTKFTIENATKTRVVVADTRIHILGSAPGKVYNRLRTVSARLNERRF